MHVWPAVIRRPVTACLTARSRSASASTTNGSEPPSSSTLFLSALPASAATNAPARSEPVSVTAATRGSAISLRRHVRHVLRRHDQAGEHARGRAGRGEHLLQRQRRARDVGRVLEERRVARHQRRPGEADDLPEREVPRHDGEDDADRLVGDDVPPVARVDGLVGEDARARSRRSTRTPTRSSRSRSGPRRAACPSPTRRAAPAPRRARAARPRPRSAARRAPRSGRRRHSRKAASAAATAASICSGPCSGYEATSCSVVGSTTVTVDIWLLQGAANDYRRCYPGA